MGPDQKAYFDFEDAGERSGGCKMSLKCFQGNWLDIVRGLNQQATCDYSKQHLQLQYFIFKMLYSVFLKTC